MKKSTFLMALAVAAAAFMPSVHAQTVNGASYGILTYTLQDLSKNDGITPAVTFLNGPVAMSGWTAQNLDTYAAANAMMWPIYNPDSPNRASASTSGVVKTVGAAQYFGQATGASTMRADNNVGGRLGTLASQASVGPTSANQEWIGDGFTTMTQAFTLTPNTAITFSLAPRMESMVQGYVTGGGVDMSVVNIADLGTGTKQANGTYSLAYTSMDASLFSSTKPAGWTGGTTFQDGILSRTLTNAATTVLNGVYYADLMIEAVIYNSNAEAPVAMAAAMADFRPMSVSAVPEPGTYAMMGLGVPFLGMFLSRSRRTVQA